MTLKSNALISVDEFISSSGISRADIKLPFFSIYNGSTDASAANISVINNTLALSVTGGVNAHSNSFDLTNVNYNTIKLLIDAINTLAKGWIINRLCSEGMTSSYLYSFASVSVLGQTSELTLVGFNGLSIEEYINGASDFIENYCMRKFIEQEYTEFFDGNGEQIIRLKQYPINSHTSICSWQNDIQSIMETFANHLDYELYLEEGMIYKSGFWTKGFHNYRAIYKAGYIFANLPYDLKNACFQIVGLLFNTKNKQGIIQENDGTRTVNYDKSATYIGGIPLPGNILAMLLPYKKQEVI